MQSFKKMEKPRPEGGELKFLDKRTLTPRWGKDGLFRSLLRDTLFPIREMPTGRKKQINGELS